MKHLPIHGLRTLPVLIILTAFPTLTACDAVQSRVNTMRESLAGLDLSLSGANESKADMPGSEKSCPEVKAMQDLKTLHDFTDPDTPEEDSKISQVSLANIKSRCQHRDKTAEVALELSFKGQLGPEGRTRTGDSPSLSYPYFIAVLDSKENIISKDVFALIMDYGTDSRTMKKTEDIRQIIPGADQADISQYTVVFGFQMDKSQLAYNRARLAEEKNRAGDTQTSRPSQNTGTTQQ